MLDCKRIESQINDFLDGTLSATQATEVNAHLEECAACRREYQALQATRALLHAATVPDGSEAQERILARFRHVVGVPSPTPHPIRRRLLPVGAVAITAAAGLVVALRTSQAPSPAPPFVVANAASDALPSSTDLERMSALQLVESYAVLRDGSELPQDMTTNGTTHAGTPIE